MRWDCLSNVGVLTPYRARVILKLRRGVEQWKLVGLITQRSLVRIQPPLPLSLSSGRRRWGCLSMDDNFVSTPKFIAFVIGFSILVTLLIVNDYGFIPIIDDANVALHEAGHFIFEPFGETMGLWGGTLGQLLPPIICAVFFWTQKSLVSVAVALLWFFENFFDIAAYIATASSEGPVVMGVMGVGIHDWWRILIRLGALQYDTTIATIVRIVGWLGLSSTLLFVTYFWWRCHKLYAKR